MDAIAESDDGPANTLSWYAPALADLPMATMAQKLHETQKHVTKGVARDYTPLLKIFTIFAVVPLGYVVFFVSWLTMPCGGYGDSRGAKR